jgi:hypothetical protein
MYGRLACVGLAAAFMVGLATLMRRCSRFLLLALWTAMGYLGRMLKCGNGIHSLSAGATRTIAAGVVHGLAQIGTLGAAGSLYRFPAPPSDANALNGHSPDRQPIYLRS